MGLQLGWCQVWRLRNLSRLLLYKRFFSFSLNHHLRIDLQQHVRHLGWEPSPHQELDLARKCQRLITWIWTFHTSLSKYLGEAIVLEKSRTSSSPIILDGNISDDKLPDAPPPWSIDIENNTLVFPSTVETDHPLLLLLKTKEFDLCQGRANDALQCIWETLGYLSFQFIDKVCTATTTSQNLCSWDGVKLLNCTLSLHRQVYNQCQKIMAQLKPEIASKYPPLLASECKISTIISDVNGCGQSQAMMSWIWGAVDGYSNENAEHLAKDPNHITECEAPPLHVLIWHWLRFQSFIFTGFAPVVKIIGGKKSSSLLNMRWSGQSGFLYSKQQNGRLSNR